MRIVGAPRLASSPHALETARGASKQDARKIVAPERAGISFLREIPTCVSRTPRQAESLKRDPFRLNRRAHLTFYRRMIFSENRFPSSIGAEDMLFEIMR
jgi:hypothetical protein